MPKVRASSTRIGTTRGPSVLVAQQLRQEAHEGLRGRDLAAFGGRLEHRLEGVERRHRELLVGLRAAVRQVAAERLAALVQVLHLRRVVGRLVERDVGRAVVGDRDVEAVAEGLDVLVVSFLVWCAVFLPSPLLPMPKPLTVLTSSTVGWPLCWWRLRRPRRPSADRGRRGAGARCRRRSSWRPSRAASDRWPKKCLRTKAPSLALNAW